MKSIFTTPKQGQKFTENPKIKRNGNEVEIQDYVETFKNDCEVYSIIEKYGCVEKIPMDTQIIEADLGEIKNLRDLKEAERRATEEWNKLPIEIKKEFGNDINDFRQNGLKYFKELNKKALEEMQKAQVEIQKAENKE